MPLTKAGQTREAITTYARAILDGSEGDGQALDLITKDAITRLVDDGKRAYTARRQQDEARAAFMRESVPKLRPVFRRETHGITADELFSIGYQHEASQHQRRPSF
jgi:hypothetical protein